MNIIKNYEDGATKRIEEIKTKLSIAGRFIDNGVGDEIANIFWIGLHNDIDELQKLIESL